MFLTRMVLQPRLCSQIDKGMKWTLLLPVFFSVLLQNTSTAQPADNKDYSSSTQTDRYAASPLVVKRCMDFIITSQEENREWEKTAWNLMTKLDSGGRNYESKFKILYSATGIYLLFSGEDSIITTTFDQDFGNLFRGDVFEAFFQTEPKTPMYLEYEVNQLDKELVLLVPHFKNFHGWIPWHYEKERKVKKRVRIVGGNMESNSHISSWTAELFFPFALFQPLENIPPVSGTIWNANFYRLDYDGGHIIKWAWSPIKKSFHEFKNFSQLLFE